jgi:ribosomal protein S18 acetylase RimI-like enzyme
MSNVRGMESRDLPSVAAIHRSILREAMGDEVEVRTESQFADLLGTHPQGCLVAEEGGAVVGFVIGSLKHWGFGLGVSGWVEVVGVSPGHMGTGVGRALGEALLAHFRAAGIRDVYTAVRWDSGDLIAFFKSIGFDKSEFINLKFSQGDK